MSLLFTSLRTLILYRKMFYLSAVERDSESGNMIVFRGEYVGVCLFCNRQTWKTFRMSLCVLGVIKS